MLIGELPREARQRVVFVPAVSETLSVSREVPDVECREEAQLDARPTVDHRDDVPRGTWWVPPHRR